MKFYTLVEICKERMAGANHLLLKGPPSCCSFHINIGIEAALYKV